MKFIETNLNDNIKKALSEIGFENLTDIQEKTINNILDGRDIVAMSNTGSGKTAAFMLPLIEKIDIENKNTQVLVITPTRELAIQIVQETRKFCKYLHGINTIAIYGGQEIRMQAINIRKGVKIVVGTPGRILDLINKKVLKMTNITSLVLDEADEMLSMGFYKEVNEIIEKVPQKSQKLMFSATIDNRVKDIANKKMKKAVYIEAKENNTLLVNNIEQFAIDVKEKMKNECVIRILKNTTAKNSIIFCNTKKKTEEVYKFIKSKNIKTEMLNSDIRQEDREKILKKLKQGKLDTIVVTDVLARGIDVEDLELVINYDIPYELEYYVHRIGRTARSGKSGVAYTLFTGKQIDKIKEIEEYTKSKIEIKDVPLESEDKEAKIDLPVSKRGLCIVTINLGKNDNIKAKDIIGAIAALTGIKSDKIGIIEVRESNSTIEVSKEYVNEIVKAFTNGKIKGKEVNVIK